MKKFFFVFSTLLTLFSFLYGMQTVEFTTFDTKIQKNKNNIQKLEKYNEQLKPLKEFSPDIQNLFNKINDRVLYLQTKKELDHLEQQPAGANLHNLKNVQKKLQEIVCMQKVLSHDEIKQINAVFLPYAQLLINTQEFFLSKEAKDLKLFVPLTEKIQKNFNFKSFNSLARNIQGDTILQHALRLKLPSISIRYLLSCGQSINDINNNKENALHIATVINHKTILELLLSYQDEIKNFFPITDETSQIYKNFASSLIIPAQINAQDILGQTPLHKACIHNIENCKRLLDFNALPTIKDNNNKQPVDYLFEKPWTYTLALICQIFSDYYEPNQLSQDDFYRNIVQEIKNIPTENLKSIISNLTEKIESYNKTKAITIYQAINEKILTPEILKRNHHVINEINKMGKTPLCWSLLTKPEYCKLLLEHNADPNKKSKIITFNKTIFLLTPLEHIPHTLAPNKSHDPYKLIELLLHYGSDPNLGSIFPPLHYMSHLNNDTGIDLLLDHKADINMMDCFGQTALHVACQRGCGKSAVELLCRNANPNIIATNDNKTALDYAYNTQCDALIFLLLSFGANKFQEKIFINDINIENFNKIQNIIHVYGGTNIKISYNKDNKKGIYLTLPKD